MRNTDRNTLDEPFLCPAVGGLGENWIVARLLAMPSDGATLQDQTMYRCFQCLDLWPSEDGTIQPLPFMNKQNITGHTNQIPFLKL